MAEIKFSFKPNYASSTTGAIIFGEDATKTYELVFDTEGSLIVRSTLKSDGTTTADELTLVAA